MRSRLPSPLVALWRFLEGLFVTVVVLGTVLFASCFGPRELRAEVAPGASLVRGVAVLPGDGSVPIPGQDVLVRDGRIAAMAATGTLDPDVTAGADVLEAAGRFLIPGLVDTHAHLTLGPVAMAMEDGQPALSVEVDPEVPRRSRLSLLAHGVTTVRDPGGDTERAVALRDAIAAGEVAGPRLVVAGRVIDHQPFAGLTDQVDDAAGVRAAVRRQVAVGVDLVKLYTTLTPDELAAGVDEAHRLGVEAVAHLHQTSWTEAARAGLDGIVHIIPGTSKLLPAEHREEYDAIANPSIQFYRWFELVDLDGPEITETIAALVEHEVTVDPTLVVFHKAFFGEDDAYTRESPELELAAPSLVANWKAFFTFNLGWTEDDFRRAEAAWPQVLAFTKKLHDAGVVLTTGTDANNPWTVPGPSLHRELELFADAGIPPLEVLATSSRNAARVLGLDHEIGTIEVGKAADLVLLRSDPTNDVSATREIEWVMQGGRVWRPDELLASLRED